MSTAAVDRVVEHWPSRCGCGYLFADEREPLSSKPAGCSPDAAVSCRDLAEERHRSSGREPGRFGVGDPAIAQERLAPGSLSWPERDHTRGNVSDEEGEALPGSTTTAANDQQRMRAVVYSQTGGPDVLRLVERPAREPGRGEVGVKVRVSGVNPTDWKARRGGGELPFPEVVPNQRQYIYGLRRIRQTQGTGTYYLYDGLGSVVNTTAPGGALQKTLSYEPYGTIRTTSGSSPTNFFHFTGEYLDPTGLYHLRARQYDPVTGRFLVVDQAEPSLTDRGVSAYAYVADRPTVMVDPSGMIMEPSNDGQAAAHEPSSPAAYRTVAEAFCSEDSDSESLRLLKSNGKLAFSVSIVLQWCWKGRTLTSADKRVKWAVGEPEALGRWWVYVLIGKDRKVEAWKFADDSNVDEQGGKGYHQYIVDVTFRVARERTEVGCQNINKVIKACVRGATETGRCEGFGNWTATAGTAQMERTRKQIACSVGE